MRAGGGFGGCYVSPRLVVPREPGSFGHGAGRRYEPGETVLNTMRCCAIRVLAHAHAHASAVVRAAVRPRSVRAGSPARHGFECRRKPARGAEA